MRKKIGVFTGTRAEAGLLHPVMRALQESADFELAVYVSGAHLDERYGYTVNEIEAAGFPVAIQIPLPALGENMARDCATITAALAEFFSDAPNRPDCLLVLGDRYETLGAVTAAFLSKIAIAHIHGGDVVGGGVLDDAIRHAITKLAHLHFPATQASAARIIHLGEESWRVTVSGSPALDNLASISTLDKSFYVDTYGLTPEKPWVLATMHPITTEPGQAGEQARQVFSALASFGEQINVLATYPNHDEGSPAIIAQLETFRDTAGFQLVRNLGRERYLNALRHVSLVVGNSSSGLLETAHFGVPCINVGSRQHGRERGGNVVDCPQDEAALRHLLSRLLPFADNPDFDLARVEALRRAPHPFGQSGCAAHILKVLRRIEFDHQLLCKQIT